MEISSGKTGYVLFSNLHKELNLLSGRFAEYVVDIYTTIPDERKFDRNWRPTSLNLSITYENVPRFYTCLKAKIIRIMVLDVEE